MSDEKILGVFVYRRCHSAAHQSSPARVGVACSHTALKRKGGGAMDLCQSVLGSFFLRAALGQYDLQTPAQLLKLLGTMARNKVVNHVHQQRAECRDNRRLAGINLADLDAVAPDPSPSQPLAIREL